MDSKTIPKPKDKPKVIPPKKEEKKEKEIDTSILGWGLAKQAADDIKRHKAEKQKLLDSI